MHQEAQLYLPELWKVSLKGCTEKKKETLYVYNTKKNKGYLGAYLPLHFLHFFSLFVVPYNQIHIYPILITTDLLTKVLTGMSVDIPYETKDPKKCSLGIIMQRPITYPNSLNLGKRTRCTCKHSWKMLFVLSIMYSRDRVLHKEQILSHKEKH